MDQEPDSPPPQPPRKSKKGRPLVLDDNKQAVLVSLIGLGVSGRMAARTVGCTWPTVKNLARRDPAFAEQLATAEIRRLATPLQHILAASTKGWRAAAWLVSRYYDQQALAMIDELRDAVARNDRRADANAREFLDKHAQQCGDGA